MKVFEINGKKYVYADVEAKEMFAVYYEDKIDYKTLIPVDELSKIDEEDMDMLRDENGDPLTKIVGIFDGAKFGDKFKTRDGRLAIYNYSPSCLLPCEKYHDIIIEGEGMSYHFLHKNNGMINTPEKEDVDYTTCIDIVSRWED